MSTELNINSANLLYEEVATDLRAGLFEKLKQLNPDQQVKLIEELKSAINAVREKTNDALLIVQTDGMYDEFAEFIGEDTKILNIFLKILRKMASDKQDNSPITKKDLAIWMASKEPFLMDGLGERTIKLICRFLKDNNLIKYEFETRKKFFVEVLF